MRRIFLGKPLHWALIAGIVLVLAWLGKEQFHRLQFMSFLLILLALSAAVVGIILRTYRHGDRVTREPLDIEE